MQSRPANLNAGAASAKERDLGALASRADRRFAYKGRPAARPAAPPKAPAPAPKEAAPPAPEAPKPPEPGKEAGAK